ncbi:hypothetical protein AJ80_04790 [Polytolypa hystricis UAMH7299]|uniref:Ankyrin repeat domain-containing protein n=1 Tax=Polytolypa hystricis (strain UAMH7299) TaxID=1447883 RepID=A0A2B7Y892_POLH7|nr:hypothetical protein AJ80_04790 [Polytolypa hystricis UAMH7299]
MEHILFPEGKAAEEAAMAAAEAKQAEELSRLIENNNELGLSRSVAFAALSSGDIATYQVLLDAGADPNFSFSYHGVNPNIGRQGPWLPPLGVAARWRPEMVPELLDAGAETLHTGALHIAAFKGDLPTMHLLVN